MEGGVEAEAFFLDMSVERCVLARMFQRSDPLNAILFLNQWRANHEQQR